MTQEQAPVPFLVLTLPRSRSAWLTQFLSVHPWTCGHDELRRVRGLEDVASWFKQPFIGSVETLGALFWRMIPEGTRVATVRRPVGEVLDSLSRVGLPTTPQMVRQMALLDAKLVQVQARIPGVLALEYQDLDSADACEVLFEHCTGASPPVGWLDYWRPVNVQVDFLALMKYCTVFEPVLMKVAKQARVKMLQDLARRAAPDLDGISIQEESMEQVMADGPALFAEHALSVGESPDSFFTKNHALWRSLDSAGAVQVVTARSNGRLFGYLATVIGPSLEYPSDVGLLATHTTFFASPEFKRLGPKMLAEAKRRLEARGDIKELFFRAAERGDPRVAKLFARMGAEPDGRMFRQRLDGGLG